MGFFSRLFGNKESLVTADYELEPSQGDEGQGFVVRRISDDQRLRWQTLPKRDGLEAVPVAGTSHRLDALQDSSFAPGQPLALVPEPANPYDPNAVAIWNAGRTLQAGYLPKERAAKLAKDLGSGPKISCMSIWETRKKKQRVALRILLVRENARVQGLSFI